MTVLLPILAFILVTALVAAGAMAWMPGPTAIDTRLGELVGDAAQPVTPVDGVRDTAVGWLTRLGAAAPRSDSEMGRLQQRLVTAGYRQREAVVIFFGLRIVIAVVSFLVVESPLNPRPSLMLALAACGTAYILPGIVLARMAKRRQHRIRLGLPDTLDLLVVCVEAGLGLDQAIHRVAEELAFAHPDLSEELRLINLELRVGKARADALHNLAARTGLDDVSSLVTMLVQTDKFGTSVAQSLRVHADTLRTKRRQRAEEAAAKTGAKMVFPLVLCIFPAIWVVTVGSAVIKFIQIILPMAHQ
jgi:tight adherence protein C